MLHDPFAFADPPETGFRARVAAFDERWPGLRRRAGGIGLALLLELGLLLLLLTLGQGIIGSKENIDTLTTVDFAPEPKVDDAPIEPQQEAKATALPRSEPIPRPDVPTPPLPVPPPPAAVLRPEPVPAPTSAPPTPPKIKAVIRDGSSGPAGPPNRGYPGDSERIAGSGPNGEPLYAARWYREPYPEELRGYLSTASGPGWALINCRTVSEFRVEDCQLVDEYPENGGMGRAVLAAAWQFKVRPPQVGGRSMVGAWVRIRITYDFKRG